MNILRFAVAIFRDEDGNIAIQSRNDKSRNNEKFAFWGGMVEKDESGLEGVTRELSEELGYVADDLQFGGEYEFDVLEGKYSGDRIHYYVYLSKITDRLMNTKVMEGDSICKIPISDIENNPNFFQCDKQLIKTLFPSN